MTALRLSFVIAALAAALALAGCGGKSADHAAGKADSSAKAGTA